MLAEINDINEAATVLATAMRKRRAADDKLVRITARDSGFVEACENSPTVMCGALRLLTQLLDNPDFRAQAYREGIARIEEARLVAGPATTKVKSALIALGSKPDTRLETALSDHRFKCVSAPDAEPVLFVGTADVSLLRPLVRLAGGTIGTYKAPAAAVGLEPQTDHSGGAEPQTAFLGSEPEVVGKDGCEPANALPNVMEEPAEDQASSTEEEILANLYETFKHDAGTKASSPNFPDVPAILGPEERAGEALNRREAARRPLMTDPRDPHRRPVPKALQDAFAPALDGLDRHTASFVRGSDDPARAESETMVSKTKAEETA